MRVKELVAEEILRRAAETGLVHFGSFSATGSLKLIFVEREAKIHAEYYCRKVIEQFVNELHKKFANNDRIFHQDPASHSFGQKS